MDVTIEQDALVTALAQAVQATESKSTIPILQNVLLRADAPGLQLTGTNLDVEVTVTAEATTNRHGSVTAPMRDLYDIARKTPKGAELNLTYDASEAGARLKIRAGRSSYVLPTLPADDFPTMESISGGTTYTILPSDLARMIDKVRHSVCTDETRFFLNGAHLTHVSEEGSDFLRMVAVNGPTMSLYDIPAPEGSDKAPPVTIYRKTLPIIRQIIDIAQKTISKAGAEVTVSSSKFTLRAGNTYLTSKVVDGSFVDYARVIRHGDGDTIARLKAPELSAAIERAAIATRDKARSLKFVVNSDGLAIRARNNEGGQAESFVDIEHTGSDTETGFNGALISDMASAVGEADMIIHLWSPADPARIHSAEDPGQLMIISPLRLN